jgi:hypothetical protein
MMRDQDVFHVGDLPVQRGDELEDRSVLFRDPGVDKRSSSPSAMRYAVVYRIGP